MFTRRADDREVELAVAVEVARGASRGLAPAEKSTLRLERAVAVAEHDADGARGTELTTAMSDLPSPLKSPTAMLFGMAPAVNEVAPGKSAPCDLPEFQRQADTTVFCLASPATESA